MRSYQILLLILSFAAWSDGEKTQCSKDDKDCSESAGSSAMVDEAAYNAYKFKSLTSREDFKIHEQLDEIDKLKASDPKTALKMIEEVLAKHPNSPRALNIIARTYRILYNGLSGEYKRVGNEEYLKKLITSIMKIIKMDRSLVPEDLISSVADFGIANCISIGNRESTIAMVKELAFGQWADIFDEEDKEFHFQTLLDETFFSGDFDACKNLIREYTKTAEDVPSISMRFLMAFMLRIEERRTIMENPLRRFNEAMINQTIPDTQTERDEIIMYTKDLEKELRRDEKLEDIDTMHDLLVDLGVYPSRYQRTMIHMKGLEANPIWQIDETGYQEKLKELEENWETIRDEAIALIAVTPDQNITMGEDFIENTRRWKQFLFHGFGVESFPDHICEIAPVTCRLLKDYEFATKCPLGTIKFSKIEAGAHLLPHVGGHNFKLRVHLPLVVPKLTGTEKKDLAKMRIGEKHNVVWEEGKLIIFDDSFEHEVWNLTSEDRIILILDLIHPDITQEQFTELEQMFTFTSDGSASGNIAKINVPSGSKLMG